MISFDPYLHLDIISSALDTFTHHNRSGDCVKATEVLMDEHRVIERVLGVLEIAAGRAERGECPDDLEQVEVLAEGGDDRRSVWRYLVFYIFHICSSSASPPETSRARRPS